MTILITAVIALIIQFGLAIWGWGGWDAFFAHPQFQALVWVSVAMSIVATFSGSSGLSSGQKEDKGNRWVLGAFGAISLRVVSFRVDRSLRILDIRLRCHTPGGCAICAVGGVLRRYPVFVLKERFSGLVAIQAGHKLETTGIYGLVRNPSYLGMIVTALGWALAFRAGVGVILVAALLIPLAARIHAEERLLRGQFGAAYDACCAHTWRLVPWIY